MLDVVVIVLLCAWLPFCILYLYIVLFIVKIFSPSLISSLFLCCIPPRVIVVDLGSLINLINKENISILWQPPWHYNAVLIMPEKTHLFFRFLNVFSFILITEHIIYKYLIFAKEWEWFSAFQKSTQRIRTMGVCLPSATHLLLKWLVFKGISNVTGD